VWEEVWQGPFGPSLMFAKKLGDLLATILKTMYISTIVARNPRSYLSKLSLCALLKNSLFLFVKEKAR
jgi:hypothetical protein